MLYHRSFTIGWMYRSTLDTCERGGFLAGFGFSHNPCKIMLRPRAPTELSMGWFWAFPFGPIHAFRVLPVMHTFSDHFTPFVFGSFCPFAHPTVSIARVHSCTWILSTLLKLVVPFLPSFLHPAAQRGSTLFWLNCRLPLRTPFLHPVPRRWAIAFNIFSACLNWST